MVKHFEMFVAMVQAVSQHLQGGENSPQEAVNHNDGGVARGSADDGHNCKNGGSKTSRGSLGQSAITAAF